MNSTLIELKKLLLDKKIDIFSQVGDGVLYYQARLCVPNVDGLKEKKLEEAHYSKYSIHLGSTRMYRGLRDVYWWNLMNKDKAKCMTM